MLIASVNGRPIDQEPFTYARPAENGWVLCPADDAVAMVVDGDLYALSEDVPVTRPPLYDDAGQLIDEAPLAPVVHVYDDPHPILDQKSQTTAQAGQITDLESSAIDLADAIDTTTAATEAALMELGDMVAALMEERE